MCLQSLAYEVDLPNPTTNIQSEWSISYSSGDPFYQTLAKIFTTYIWKITWVVAFVVVVTAWYWLLSSTGKSEDLKKANKMLLWWLVGILVSLLAYTFVMVLINLF